MFGSTVLEIALGLTMLYLGLSVVCSALNEYLSAVMGRRATHLRDALFGLLNKDDPKGRRMIALFFSHPLIGGLSPSAWVGKGAAKGLPGDPLKWATTEVDSFLKRLRNTPHY